MHVLSDVLLPPASLAEAARSPHWAAAELDSARDAESLGVFGYLPAQALDAVLRELASRLAGPRYSDRAIVEARTRLSAQVGIRRGEARWTAMTALLRRRHPVDALPCDVPSPEHLTGVEPAWVRALHGSRLSPRGAVLVLVGDFPAAGIAQLAEEALAEWQGCEAPAHVPASAPVAQHEVVLIDRPRSAQAEIVLVGPALHRTHERRPALDVANTVFGGGIASRLGLNVREDKGFAYLTASAIEVLAGSPATVVRLAASEAHAAAALAETRGELTAMTESPPSPEEMAAAKRLLAGQANTAAASPSSLATLLVNLAAEGADPSSWLADYGDRLAAVHADDVATAAATYFDPGALDTAVVGDAEALAGPLEKVPGVRVRRCAGLHEVTASAAHSAASRSFEEARR
ncbi:insulinase family protein [Streptomyces sp. NPDC048737]|uniref:M16 family metallopeptidase n=1 Tax=unclassified Streptomyces TaxID=2593676 RepID=UPI0034468B29